MRNQLISHGTGAVLFAAFTYCGPTFAQVPGPSPAAGVVSGQPGLTETQRATAVAIETFCPFLPTPNVSGSATERLSASCTAMVVNASSSETPGALQAIASEELFAPGRVATSSTGGNAISGRLLALRSGGRGLMLAGSTVTIDGIQYAAADLLPVGTRGGGAAADSSFGGRWGGFINAHYNTGDRDDSALEDSFDFDDYGLTAGVDYRISDALVAGVALSWSDTEVDFDRNLGSVDTDTWGLTGYGSYTHGPWYVDAQLAYASLDFDSRRNIVVAAPIGFNTAAKGSTDGDQWSASVGAGYNMSHGDITVTPYGRLDYLRLKVDGFTESEPAAGLGLDIGDQTTKSLQTAIGARVSKAISTTSGVLTPYATLEWNHEYQNDRRTLVAKYTADPFNTFFAIPTEDPDRNFFTLGLGVVAVYPNGLSAFANVDAVLGLEKTDSYAFTIGLRSEF